MENRGLFLEINISYKNPTLSRLGPLSLVLPKRRDLYSHDGDTTPKKDGPTSRGPRSASLLKPSHVSETKRTHGVLGEWRPRTFQKKHPGQGGGRFSTATRLVKGTGQDGPEEPVHGIQDPMCCREEAVLWPSVTEYPGGTSVTNGKRGGLVGATPRGTRRGGPER